MDFVTDALGTGRSFRVLSIVDDRTRECLALEPDTSLPGSRVVQILNGLRADLELEESLDNVECFVRLSMDMDWRSRRLGRQGILDDRVPIFSILA